MGIKVLTAFICAGKIDTLDYPKYIIPYTPVCIAVIVAAALVPLTVKYLKKILAVYSVSAGYRCVPNFRNPVRTGDRFQL